MPSGNTPWPITPAQGQSLDLAETYGQFSAGGFLHFHEGIDILAANNTPFKAVEAGTVSALNLVKADPGKFVEISTGAGAAKVGWQYLHITPGNNARTGAAYAWGDAVGPADKAAGLVDNLGIGTVAPFGGGWDDHLHLTSGKGEDPYLVDVVGAQAPNKLLQPAEDPLDLLTPLGDAVAPTVEEILFRAGGWDTRGNLSPGRAVVQGNKVTVIGQSEAWSGDQHYFITRDVAGNAIIVGANAPTNTNTTAGLAGDAGIDIVGKAYDKIRTNGAYKLGVKSIGFSITGQRIRTTPMNVSKSFDFTGEFAPDSDFGGGQTYVSLWNAQQVRAVYSNDLRAKSIDGVQYYYTVTNKDGDLKIQAADRDRQWFSKKTTGSAWNNGAAADAANNAKSEWPDDYYDVEVIARDEAAMAGLKTEKVLLDNWTQTLKAKMVERGAGAVKVEFTGEQFTANSTVALYLITSPISDGNQISSHGTYIGLADTDADGKIIPIQYWVDEPNDPNSVWYFLADYHNGGDNIYQLRLDATSLLIEDGGLPGGMSMSPGGLELPSFDPNPDPNSEPVSATEPVLPVQDWMPPMDQETLSASDSPSEATDATVLIRALIGEPSPDFGLTDHFLSPDRFVVGV